MVIAGTGKMTQEKDLGRKLSMAAEQLPAVCGLHDQNEVGLADQRRGEGLGPVPAEIDSVLLGHEHGEVGRRISGHGNETSGVHVDVR
jgi:hypothetical protein